jgi:hypothetical protein
MRKPAEGVILCDNGPAFVLYRITQHYGLFFK